MNANMDVRGSYELPWYLKMLLPFLRRPCCHTLPHPFAPACTILPELPTPGWTPYALRHFRWEHLHLVFLLSRESNTFLRECGGDGCSRSERGIENKGWGRIHREVGRSAYQYKTENHEWLDLVPIHRGRMVNDGVKTLDVGVVGGCHVAKCVPVSHTSISNESKLTWPDNQTYLRSHQVVILWKILTWAIKTTL